MRKQGRDPPLQFAPPCLHINESDHAFIGKIYPKPSISGKLTAPGEPAWSEDDWPASEDVAEIAV